ncbi:DMT family transporter [Bacillus sp. V2I10]|uniref:DMT family transporter n=1 Tax=Bacillus sp. V2I10 TaxID=3042276 RepID=UPI002780F3E7|nr:EamA family transporter [Bacillus sp. V2I10]MDQ0859118.1 drug/metabolite transporter (DMT)-like permease [Bacillus sp. V2I10]
MKKSWAGAVCLSLAAGIWGGMYVVSKYVLEYIPPFTLVWLRFIIAFAVLFTLLKISQKGMKPKYSKQDYILFAWIGFIGYFVSILCQFIGTKLSDAHTGALLTSATPAFVVLFAGVILKEKITPRKLISVLLATIGVIIVIGYKQNMEYSGSLFLVLAAVTWALLSVFVKIASKRFSSLTITTYAISFAVIFTSPFAVWEWNVNAITDISPLVITGILYLGIISTAGAFFLWNKGMELMEAGAGSLFFFFQPLTGAFLGWLLLNEGLSPSFFLGGACIIAGVILVSVKNRVTD